MMPLLLMPTDDATLLILTPHWPLRRHMPADIFDIITTHFAFLRRSMLPPTFHYYCRFSFSLIDIFDSFLRQRFSPDYSSSAFFRFLRRHCHFFDSTDFLHFHIFADSCFIRFRDAFGAFSADITELSYSSISPSFFSFMPSSPLFSCFSR
jgi:hypothetical protein